jgi:hypothetical protein
VYLRPAPDGAQEEGLVEPVGPFWRIKYNEKRQWDCEEGTNAPEEDEVIHVGGNDQGGAKDPIDKQYDGAYQTKELERFVSICELGQRFCRGVEAARDGLCEMRYTRSSGTTS